MHKKNKFLIVCLSLACAALLFSATFAVMGRANLLHKVGASVIYPFEWVFSSIGDAASGFGNYFSSIDELMEENQKLREENESLRAELEEADVIKDENSRLYAYLSMKELFLDYQMCEAPVVSVTRFDGENAISLTLGKGSSSGIAVNMPVVTEVGLVGYVTEVGGEWCRVKTLLNTSAVVSATVSDLDASGMTNGEYSLIGEGLFKMIELDGDIEVDSGNMVVTRGDGSVYPYGIPIGEIVSSEKNPYSRTTEATVKPFSDLTFSKKSHVMIITGYSTKPVESHENE